MRPNREPGVRKRVGEPLPEVFSILKRRWRAMRGVMCSCCGVVVEKVARCSTWYTGP